MMPPICEICGKDFRHNDQEGGLVHFTLTEAQREANRRFEQPGFTGHPDGLYWFCGKHIARAQELKELTSAEALSILRQEEELEKK